MSKLGPNVEPAARVDWLPEPCRSRSPAGSTEIALERWLRAESASDAASDVGKQQACAGEASAAACAGEDPFAAMLPGDAMEELRTPRGAVGKRAAMRLVHAGTEAADARPVRWSPEILAS
ncbi:hypothetical protein WMF26_08015 [Sorangium sp. So ce185]|uniref:hypothetical protein n=1 Tax=Sorangium sp. So ce185 TaxID=3133287 RepID=UPI003F63022C